ncbi:MAG TPA: hypothetical protein VF857_00780, partial [Spirochaetota bacterium]
AVIRACGSGGEIRAQGKNEFSLYDHDAVEKFIRLEQMILSMNDPVTRFMLAGRLYESYGLISPALDEYEKAFSAGDNDPTLRPRIAKLRQMID